MDTNQVSVGTSVELETLLWPLGAKMALEELLIRSFSIVPEVDNPWEDYCLGAAHLFVWTQGLSRENSVTQTI